MKTQAGLHLLISLLETTMTVTGMERALDEVQRNKFRGFPQSLETEVNIRNVSKDIFSLRASEMVLSMSPDFMDTQFMK